MRFTSTLSRRLSAFLLLFLALVLVGCGDSPDAPPSAKDSPELIVEKYFRAVSVKRVDDAMACYSQTVLKRTDPGKLRMAVGAQHLEMEKKGGLVSVKTTVMEQKEDTASVKASMKFKNGESERTFQLVKEDGWKIVL